MPRSYEFQCRLLKHPFWVLPYVRGRLVFAEMAVKAMLKKNFDTILLDLPSFMNQKSWLDAPLEAFPLVSSLLIKGNSGNCSIYAFVQTDAACAVAWLAQRRALPFECVDPMSLDCLEADIPTIPVLENERLVSKIGCRPYFEAAWLHLDGLWERAPDSSIKSLIAHGKSVADRISAKVTAGRETIFICEYRLWWAVGKALKSESVCRAKDPGNDKGKQTRSCALLLEDPYFMWAAGLFDDYPAVNKRFQESLVSGSVESFDKFSILSDLIKKCSDRGDTAAVPNDAFDKLTSLAHDLKCKLECNAEEGVSPAQFLKSMNSRFGPESPESRDAVSRLFLDYPLPMLADIAKNPPEYFEISRDKIIPSNKWFELPDVFHALPYGGFPNSEMTDISQSSEGLVLMPWSHYVQPLITRQEAKALADRTSDFRWAVERDYELHTHACALARDFVSRTNHSELEEDVLGLHTPIVFIFSGSSERPHKLTLVSDNNSTRRQMELQGFEFMPPKNEPSPDLVYSLFATVHALETLYEDHIERELLDSLAILFSGSGMGVERYTAINREPKRYQCRIRPQEDPALKAFQPSELGLAWAIKYARRVAIVATDAGWQPSRAVKKFVSSRRKRILIVPFDAFPEGLVNRLRQLHFISTALKRHPECKRIVARFVN
jgi:hypothetical protein